MNRPPRPDEIEVSIFGPSYGESVVVHTGNNEWLIVDSCNYPSSREPIPLNYLKQLGVEPSRDVKLIVATHWHDDHVRGLSSIFRECESAEFVFSEAVASEYFITLAKLLGGGSFVDEGPCGVDEFCAILTTMEERRRTEGNRWISPILAGANKRLWQNQRSRGNTSDLPECKPCVVYSLSPSDTASVLAKSKIAELIPESKDTKKRIPNLGTNYFSVVLWIDFEECAILLGADLEELGEPTLGWSAILVSKARPAGKAFLFKIPHHGSKTGHHPDLWSEMIEADPVAILAPCVRGANRLPTSGDITRLLSYTNETYITSLPVPKRRRKRDRTTEKLIHETVRSLKEVYFSTGQVRVRALPSDCEEGGRLKWSVDLFNGAQKLSA